MSGNQCRRTLLRETASDILMSVAMWSTYTVPVFLCLWRSPAPRFFPAERNMTFMQALVMAEAPLRAAQKRLRLQRQAVMAAPGK